MTLSYSGGIHDIFIMKDGKRFDRLTHPYIFNSIESVEVTVVNDGMATGKVHFTPSYNDAVRILKDGILGLGTSRRGQHPQEAEGGSVAKEVKTLNSTTATASDSSAQSGDSQPLLTTIVSVRFLYPGQSEFTGGAEASTPWFSMMLSAPDLNINGTEISFTMNLHSSAVIAKSVTYQTSYNGQSVYSVVEGLARTLGTEIGFDEGDTKTPELLRNKSVTGAFNLSPFYLIQRLLKQADCYFYFFSGTETSPKDKLQIKSRESVQSDPADYTFVVFKQISPANRVIPVYDVQLESSGSMFVKGAVFGSRQEGIRSDNKENLSVKVGTKTDKAARTGGATGGGSLAVPKPSEKGAGVDAGVRGLSGKTKATGSHTGVLRSGNVSNEDKIQSDTLQKGTVGNKYRIVSPGLPNLFPSRIVRIEFADIAELTGMGTVMQVTHKSGAGGWETEFEFHQSSSVLANGSKTVQKEANKSGGQNQKKLTTLS